MAFLEGVRRATGKLASDAARGSCPVLRGRAGVQVGTHVHLFEARAAVDREDSASAYANWET